MADEEIKVVLTADAAQLKAGMEESAAAVNASMAQVKAGVAAATTSITQMGADFTTLDEIMAGHVKKAADVAAAEQSLDRLMASGAITAEEQAAAFDALAASEKVVTAATLETAEATEVASTAFKLNSRMGYSLSAMLSDAMSGQFGRSKREIAALANESGVLSRALGFIMSPVGMVAMAVAGMGVAVVEADDHYAKFEQTILRTGDIIGMSAGELQGMADNIGTMTGHAFEAVDAVNELGSSGRFTGEALQTASLAAVNFATVTGENVKNAGKIIESMAEKPKEAIAKVNDQFHFLTQSQADLIEKLLATGQNAQAATVAIQAFNGAFLSRKDEMESHASALARDWHNISGAVEEAAEHMAEYIEVSNGGGDAAEKLGVAERKLANDQQIASHWWSDRWGLMAGVSSKQLAAEQANVDKLKEEITQQDNLAAAKAKTARATAKQFDGAMGAKKKGGGNPDHDAAQADRDEYNEQRLNHQMSLAEEQKFWNGKLAAAQKGTQEYRQAVEQLLQIKNKEATQSAEAGRKEAADAKRIAAEKVRDAKQVAEAKRKAAQQALQIDEAQNSATRDLTNATLQTKKSALDAELAEGKITNEQALAAYKAIIQGRYAADLAYYQQKEKLESGDATKLIRDQTNIAVSYQHMLEQLEQIEGRFHAKSQSEWQKYSQRIEGSMQSAVNGMIFQHETFRNAAAQVAESIAENFIDNEIRTRIFHKGTEDQKTAATAVGAAQRETIEAAAAVKSVLVSAETTMKQIMMKGWEAIANTWAAISAIPMVGPFLAPAAAVAAGAAVFALASNVASAEGGWDRVPFDGAQAILHKDEMVLPAHIANPMRQMATQGVQRGGTENHYHFSAMDVRSFTEAARRNEGAFADVMRRAYKNGRFLR